MAPTRWNKGYDPQRLITWRLLNPKMVDKIALCPPSSRVGSVARRVLPLAVLLLISSSVAHQYEPQVPPGFVEDPLGQVPSSKPFFSNAGEASSSPCRAE